jgi:apolipoprotein N-acyltransferase
MEYRKWLKVPETMVEVVTIQPDGTRDIGWINPEFWDVVQKAYSKIGIQMERLEKPTTVEFR